MDQPVSLLALLSGLGSIVLALGSLAAWVLVQARSSARQATEVSAWRTNRERDLQSLGGRIGRIEADVSKLDTDMTGAVTAGRDRHELVVTKINEVHTLLVQHHERDEGLTRRQDALESRMARWDTTLDRLTDKIDQFIARTGFPPAASSELLSRGRWWRR